VPPPLIGASPRSLVLKSCSLGRRRWSERRALGGALAPSSLHSLDTCAVRGCVSSANRRETCCGGCCDSQQHPRSRGRADAEAIRLVRANHVDVVTLPPRYTQCMRAVGVVWAKSFKDGFSALVSSQTDQSVLYRLTMVTGEPVTDASEAMRERAAFVVCGLNAYDRQPRRPHG
jgi:hypothetical protein